MTNKIKEDIQDLREELDEILPGASIIADLIIPGSTFIPSSDGRSRPREIYDNVRDLFDDLFW